MSYAQNKSLEEYGDLNSMHHSDRQSEREAGDRELEIQSQPPFLEARLQLGGSYVIEWSKGEEEVPFECLGIFTGTSQATTAIKLAMKRLTAEAEQRQQDALDASFEEAAKTEEALEVTAPLDTPPEPKVRTKASRKKSA